MPDTTRLGALPRNEHDSIPAKSAPRATSGVSLDTCSIASGWHLDSQTDSDVVVIRQFLNLIDLDLVPGQIELQFAVKWQSEFGTDGLTQLLHGAVDTVYHKLDIARLPVQVDLDATAFSTCRHGLSLHNTHIYVTPVSQDLLSVEVILIEATGTFCFDENNTSSVCAAIIVQDFNRGVHPKQGPSKRLHLGKHPPLPPKNLMEIPLNQEQCTSDSKGNSPDGHAHVYTILCLSG
eukprot:TRINITY_DN11730_c0_g1_i4.p1 TRINITY_DN11730_c0_g1~~TRINITY_DN11730_c0_g1_i4.p1  ORF type:complete len:235 (-),score=11.26 TRINITY_DN11730_c0_g1_i4:327-1031(-)